MNTPGSFYTNGMVSNLMISHFTQESPELILDMGVGEGSLLNAAYDRWKLAKYYAVDINTAAIASIEQNFPFVNFYKIDGLSSDFHTEMQLRVGTVDIAICNPPYLKMNLTNNYAQLFKETGLHESLKLTKITSDVVFLAQNLKMLKDKGELGIILPDSIFTGSTFSKLRADIIHQHKIKGIIQLPDNIFKKTEARTHILLLEKNGVTPSFVPVYKASTNGYIREGLFVQRNDLFYRMDYNFNRWNESNRKTADTKSLKELNVEITRGRHTKKDLEKMKIKYFHTTSFPSRLNDRIVLENSTINNGVIAKRGDILIARVGKRCIGKVTIIEQGQQVITDCIFRIRPPSGYKKKIWKSLTSEAGQEWLKANAHGVCAQVINKTDLLNFPIPE
jgi:type I restriction-modification system DNA methylase subunit